VILITGHGDVPMAVEAMRLGAFDFLEKPFDPEKMTELARRAVKARALALENRALRQELADGKTLMRRLVGASPVMVRLREDILDYGQADGHVLIDGETGTGKTLVAHALHAVGPRAGKRFVTVSCQGEDEGAGGAAVRPGRGGRRPAAGRGGARRHAVPGGCRGAEPGAAGAASGLHQRAGQPGRRASWRSATTHAPGPHAGGRCCARTSISGSPR
jgi:hypothetical protein